MIDFSSQKLRIFWVSHKNLNFQQTQKLNGKKWNNKNEMSKIEMPIIECQK